MSTLLTTKEYKSLKIRQDNRKTSDGQIRQLMESIEKHGFITPIIVNSKMEIIDGQNRVKAAQNLGVPIEYKVHDGNGKMAELLADLQISSKWKAKDYLRYYIRHNRKDYKEFKKFITEYEISISVGVMLFFSTDVGGTANNKFKKGLLIVDDEKMADATNKIKKINIIRMMCDGWSHFRNEDRFVRAIYTTQNHRFYRHTEMIKKIKKDTSKIRKATSVRDYVWMFNHVINDGRPWEKEINFLKKPK